MVDKEAEEKALKEIGIPDPETREEFFYGALGACLPSEDNSFAKIVQIDNRKTCYVKYGRGEIFDPYGIDREKIKRPYYSFKKVNNKIFDHYVSYLKTEKRIFLTRANRLMMEV